MASVSLYKGVVWKNIAVEVITHMNVGQSRNDIEKYQCLNVHELAEVSNDGSEIVGLNVTDGIFISTWRRSVQN